MKIQLDDDYFIRLVTGRTYELIQDKHKVLERVSKDGTVTYYDDVKSIATNPIDLLVETYVHFKMDLRNKDEVINMKEYVRQIRDLKNEIYKEHNLKGENK